VRDRIKWLYNQKAYFEIISKYAFYT
jgi:hypothetical protein